MDQSHAILLRRYRFSENSLVVVWLTERHGKVKTAVRGATRTGSPFAGRLELFTEAEIAFKAPKSGDLHTLSEVVMEPDAALPATYPTILTASYFAELCDLVTEPMHPVPEIHSLLKRAWGYLRQGKADRRGVVHFEGELVKALGVHDPSLPPHRSLSSLLHRLPESRSRVLDQLAEG
jgi:DNA repair protein RecO (recombination protein O)